jgi:hypothetical protein
MEYKLAFSGNRGKETEDKTRFNQLTELILRILRGDRFLVCFSSCSQLCAQLAAGIMCVVVVADKQTCDVLKAKTADKQVPYK